MENKMEKFLMDYMEKNGTAEVTLGDIRVTISRFMTLEEKSNFVDLVASKCFKDDEYLPENRNVVFDVVLAQYITDLELITTKNVDDDGNETDEDILNIDASYFLIKALNLKEALFNYKEVKELYEELKALVAEKIIFEQQRILMGEKKRVDKLIDEAESGIALIEVTAQKLTEQMQEVLDDEEFMKNLPAALDKTTEENAK